MIDDLGGRIRARGTPAATRSSRQMQRRGHPAPSRSPLPPPAGLARTTTPWRHPGLTSPSLSLKKREGAHPSPTQTNRHRREPPLPCANGTTTRPQQHRCRPPHSEVKTDLGHRPAPPAAIHTTRIPVYCNKIYCYNYISLQ